MRRQVIAVLLVSAFVLVIAPAAAQGTTGLLPITEDTTLTEDHTGWVLIGADNVTLDCQGFTVTSDGSSQWGIANFGHSGVTVQNCNVAGFSGTGILFSECTQCWILDNTVVGSSETNNFGIQVNASQEVMVTGNTSSRNDFGFVVFNDASNNVFAENTSRNNLRGAFALTGEPVAPSQNTIDSNIMRNNGQGGIYLGQSHNNTIINNQMTRNGNGIQAVGSDGNVITGNTFRQPKFFGVLFQDGSDGNVVSSNTTTGGFVGFAVEGSAFNEFSANVAERNGFGFSIRDGALENTIVGNTANKNAQTGFSAETGSQRNLFEQNAACKNRDVDASDLGIDNLWVDNDFCTPLQ